MYDRARASKGMGEIERRLPGGVVCVGVAAWLLLLAAPGRAAGPPSEPPRVVNVDYVDGAETVKVVVELSGPAQPRLVPAAEGRAVLEIAGAAIAPELERSLDVSEFDGPVTTVSSFRAPEDPGLVRIVVELAEPQAPVMSHSGRAFTLAFRRPRGMRALAADAPPPRAASFSPPLIGAYDGAPATQALLATHRKVYRGKRIDIDFKDVDIQNLLRLLAEVGGVNVVVPDDVKATVTVRLRNVPWDQAMEVILASKGMWYRREGNLILVALRATLDAEDLAEAERQRARVQQENPEPEIFTLNYATAEGLAGQVKSLLSPKGKIEVDPRTNSVIVNDLAAHRRRIIDLLTRLDTQTPQIEIEARVVEARTTFKREVGIQWGFAGIASAQAGNPTGLVFPSSVTVGGGATDSKTPTAGVAASPDFAVNLPAPAGTGQGGAVGFTFGSVGGNFNLSLRLSAAEDSGTVRIVSAPKITVVNNAQASISQGVSIPISVVSAQGVQTQFVPADLELKVTPHVSQRDCSILLDIQVKKNEADFVNTGARGDPTILRKEAKTTMLIGDGETSVIGGIYTRNSGLAHAKVPLLADLFIIGPLFRSKRENDDRTEVLIFLTPKITNKASLRCEAQP